jgi:hypothetical protein
MPEPLFQPLFDETETMTWAPTDVVRDRARRRTRRARGAAVVALGVISGGVAVARLDDRAGPQRGIAQSSADPSPSPTGPSPSSSPAGPSPSARPAESASPSVAEPTALVDALFVQPGDVGTGYRATPRRGRPGRLGLRLLHVDDGLPEPGLEPVARCEAASGDVPGAVRVSGGGEPGAVRGPLPGGDAARYLDHVRAQVAACKPDNGRTIRIGAQRFAGQDSLLEVDYGDDQTSKLVLVRQGDLVTEFFAKPERAGAATQELGRRAAYRLCGGTPVC